MDNNDDDIQVFRVKDEPSHEKEDSIPHIAELKALHPDSEIVEFIRPPRFLVVIRQQISEEAAKQFVSDFQSRGIEVAVVCFGNAEALPERCIFGNILESM